MTQFFIKFKAYFEGDVRRFSFEIRPTYAEFTKKLTDIYSQLDDNNIHVTYKDDTNDNISITNILDFDEALNFYKDSGFDILRLYISNKVNSNNSSSNNNNSNIIEKKNVGDLEFLFVSLLSNQMIQQMIPQVINGLASNPSIMTSIIQTAGSSLRSQSILQNSHLDSKSPNTFHTQSTDSIVLSLPNISGNNNNCINTPTTTTTTTNSGSALKKSTDEAYSTMITSSSSSSSLLDIAKSFEEIESSPTSTSVIATNSNTSPSTVSSDKEKEKKLNPNILSQVPKIFQNIHLPFTSKPDSPNNSVVQFKKEENIPTSPIATVNTTTQVEQQPSTTVPIHEYVPQQIYPIANQPMPYSSPNFSYQLPTNNTSITNPQPYQPPQPYIPIINQPSILQVKPTAPVIPQTLIKQQPQQQPQQQQQQQQQPQQQPQQPPTKEDRDSKLKFIQEALGVSLVKANELFNQHKGNVEEIFEQNN